MSDLHRHVSHNEIRHFTRHWGARKFRRKFRRPISFARRLRKFRSFKCTWRSCFAWQLCNTKMDVVLAGLNDTPSGRLLVLSPLTKKDKFCWVWVLRSVMLAVILRYLKKFQFDRCWPWMRLPSSVGLDLRGPRLSLLEAIHGALALPADFERKRRAPSTWTG